MEANTTTIVAALIIGVPVALKFAVDFVKWLASRTVEHEDKAKAKLEVRVDGLDARYTQLDKDVSNLKTAHENQRDSLSQTLGNITGQLNRLDTRISESHTANEKRFKESLSELALDLNQKLSRMLASEIPELVRQTLSEERTRVRGRGRAER